MVEKRVTTAKFLNTLNWIDTDYSTKVLSNTTIVFCWGTLLKWSVRMSHSLSTTTFLSWTCLKEQLCRDCRNNRDLLVTSPSSFFNPECVPQQPNPKGQRLRCSMSSRIKYTDCFKSKLHTKMRRGRFIFNGLTCERLLFLLGGSMKGGNYTELSRIRVSSQQCENWSKQFEPILWMLSAVPLFTLCPATACHPPI